MIIQLALAACAFGAACLCGCSHAAPQAAEPQPQSPIQAEGVRTAAIETVTEATFDSRVLDSAEPVLVEFVGTLSPPCEKMAPIVDELARRFAGRAKFARLNIDRDEKLADKYRITFVPAFVLFKQTRSAKLGQGEMAQGELAAKIDEALGSR